MLVRCISVSLVLLLVGWPPAAATTDPAPAAACSESSPCVVARWHFQPEGEATPTPGERPVASVYFESGRPFSQRTTPLQDDVIVPWGTLARVVLADRENVFPGEYATRVVVAVQDAGRNESVLASGEFVARRDSGIGLDGGPARDLLLDALAKATDGDAAGALAAIDAACALGARLMDTARGACGAFYGDPRVSSFSPCRKLSMFPPGSTGSKAEELYNANTPFPGLPPCSPTLMDEANRTARELREPTNRSAEVVAAILHQYLTPAPDAPEDWSDLRVPLSPSSDLATDARGVHLPAGARLVTWVYVSSDAAGLVGEDDAASRAWGELADAAYEHVPDGPPVIPEEDPCPTVGRWCPVARATNGILNDTYFIVDSPRYAGDYVALRADEGLGSVPRATFRYGSLDAPSRLELQLDGAQAPLPSDASPIREGAHAGQVFPATRSSRYAFEVDDGHGVRLDADGAAMDVVDPRGREVATGVVSFADPYAAPGEWLLTIRPQSADGTFRFLLQVAPSPGSDDAASGRDASKAFPVTLDRGAYAGDVGTFDDEDTYAVDLLEGETLDVTLDAEDGLQASLTSKFGARNATTPTDTHLRVSAPHDAERVLVTVVRASGDGGYGLTLSRTGGMDRSLLPTPTILVNGSAHALAAAPEGIVLANEAGLWLLEGSAKRFVRGDLYVDSIVADAAGALIFDGYADVRGIHQLSTLTGPARPVEHGLEPIVVGADGHLYHVGRYHDSPFRIFRTSPEGASVAVANATFPVGFASDGRHAYQGREWEGPGITETDLSTGEQRVVYPTGSFGPIAVSSDGILYAASRNQTLVRIDPSTGAADVIAKLPDGAWARDLLVLDDRLLVASAGPVGFVAQLEVPGLRAPLPAGAFSPAPLPDLVVVDLEVAPASPGPVPDTRRIDVTIANVGPGFARGKTVVDLQDGYVVSCVQARDPGCGWWSRIVAVDLAPGETKTVSFSWDATGQPGTHPFVARVGPGEFAVDFVVEPRYGGEPYTEDVTVP